MHLIEDKVGHEFEMTHLLLINSLSKGLWLHSFEIT